MKATGTVQTFALGILFSVFTAFFAGNAYGVPGYTLTINVAGSGYVTRDVTNSFYPPGVGVTLTAFSNNPTWHFSGWSGDEVGTNNPIVATMNSNKVVTATFLQFNTFTLSLATNGQGGITLSPTGGVYASNTVVTATATPAAGWVFVSWAGSVSGNSNPIQVTLNTNRSETANFAQLPAFDVQPQNITTGVSNAVSFISHSVGTAPVSYQWYFNGNILSGATSSNLPLTSVQLANAGNYQVIAANAYGSATSSVVTLVITNGTPATNVLSITSESSLRAAIAAGGWIGITCNGTITLTNTINITNNVILDGTGVSLVISGNNANRIFTVAAGATLRATNLTLANGVIALTNGTTADGGAIYNNGTVELVSCTLVSNKAYALFIGSARGGAICNSNGTVLLNACTLCGNSIVSGTNFNIFFNGGPSYGGAIYSTNGTFSLNGCSLNNNVSSNIAVNSGSPVPSLGGAICLAAGSLNITNSTFATNAAIGGSTPQFQSFPPNPAYGGAIAVIGGNASIDHCQFTGNVAQGGNAYRHSGTGEASGGAVYSTSVLTMESCSLAANAAAAGSFSDQYLGEGRGGAIYNSGTATLNRCSLYSNFAHGANAIPIGLPTGAAHGANGYGGAIFNTYSMALTNCTVALNSAVAGLGNGIGNGYMGTDGDAYGGGIYNVSNLVAMNITIASNLSVSANSVATTNGFTTGSQIANSNGVVRLHNSLIANGTTNVNIYGPTTDDGYNFNSDGTASVSSGNSYNFTDSKLLTLADNLGPTLTMALRSNSPAIDFSDSSGVPPTDQRGYTRPYGSGVDVGAFEYYPFSIPQPAFVRTNSNFAFAFTAYPPVTYRLQSSTNMVLWTDVLTNGPYATITNVNWTIAKTNGAYFYRLLLK